MAGSFILLFHFSPVLRLNIPGRTVVEIILAILFHDLLVALCPLGPDLIRELPGLFLIFLALDSVPALNAFLSTP